MIEKKKIFFNKKILIYGLGKTGTSSYKFLKKNNKVFLFDDNKKNLINKKTIIKSNFDYILISPGININQCILKNYIKKEKNRENRRKVFLGLRCALCFQHIFTLLVVGRL